MAETITSAAVIEEQWADGFYREYVRLNAFTRYMGTDENSIIQVNEDLAKAAGEFITFDLTGKLDGDGVTGTATLEGNEEALDNFGYRVTVDMLRNATRRHVFEQQKTHIDYLRAGERALKDWSTEKMRDQIIRAMESPVRSSGAVAYADASEAQKDVWVDDNADRVLFGEKTGNRVAGDHSASLGVIDNTADKLTPELVSLARRLARLADPIIRPIMIDEGGEWYVMFVPSFAWRDLKENTTFQNANRDAMLRGKDNPLFKDGDLLWDGVILREVPEINIVTGVGAGGIDVASAIKRPNVAAPSRKRESCPSDEPQ